MDDVGYALRELNSKTVPALPLLNNFPLSMGVHMNDHSATAGWMYPNGPIDRPTLPRWDEFMFRREGT